MNLLITRAGTRGAAWLPPMMVALVCGVAIASGGRAGGVAPGTPASNLELAVNPVPDEPYVEPTDGPVIQLALLLDTSNSMDGLIDQAKTKLWAIVNELARTQCGGRTPQLQVALYEYGNNGIPAQVGHIRRRVSFTTDLDAISEQLFSLRTNGGSEYCGWAIDVASRELAWYGLGPVGECVTASEGAMADGTKAEETKNELEDEAREAIDSVIAGPGPGPMLREGPTPAPGQSVVRIIVIAGNEPFTQGTVPFIESVPLATSRGIIVNTIFCGPQSHGQQTGWEAGAQLGNGRYAFIDQNRAVVVAPTPFDKSLVELNTRLNRTYLPYGQVGMEGMNRQLVQDQLNLDRDFSRRIASKATRMYVNSHWDLVDLYIAGKLDLEKINDDELPEAMRGKSSEAQMEVIKAKRAERATVQSEIGQITLKREAYLSALDPASAAAGGAALDDALIGAMLEQLEAAGFTRVEVPEAVLDPGTEPEPKEKPAGSADAASMPE